MLFSPLRVGAMTLANRVAVPAMVTRLSGSDGVVNAPIVERYRRFALGGAGMIVVEATAIHDAKSGPLLRLASDDFIPGHRRLVQAVREVSNARVLPQIIHFLKVARSGWRQTIDSLSAAEIDGIVAAFAAAARRAREAGYDGVELHAAHAYTLASFLSRRNPRRDDYDGRTAVGRLRLPTRVVRAVRREVGDDFTVGVRILADEAIKDGSTVSDAQEVAEHLAALGVDYVSLSVGGKFEDAVHRPGHPLYPYTGYSGDRCMPDHRYPACTNLELMARVTAHLRAAGHATPVLAAGKISTRSEAEAILAGGHADIVGMARQLLADPSWPAKQLGGREAETVRCIYCNVCKQLDENFREVRCFLWPRGHQQAPADDAGESPRWPAGGPELGAQVHDGEVRLAWAAAVAGAAQAAIRYEVQRLDHAAASTRVLGAVKGTRFVDRRALPGRRYTYCVHGFDAAGRSTVASNPVGLDFEPDSIPGRDSTPLRPLETSIP